MEFTRPAVNTRAKVSLGFLCAAIIIPLGVHFVHAVPPPSPTRTDLIKRSDLIAIVTVTNVVNHVSADVAWKQGTRESAIAVVERTIKGTAPTTLRVTFDGPPLRMSCRPPSLSPGQFLMFLRREGDSFVRTDDWYSQATISTNHVCFPMEQAVDLKIAVSEIEWIVRNR